MHTLQRLLLAASLFIITPQATQAQTPTFDDEFNSLDLSGKGNWQPNATWANPDGKNADPSDLSAFFVNPTYAPLAAANPYSVSNGVLDIAIKPTPSSINPADVNNKPYVTGMMQTAKKFSQLYGYFEVRAKLPAGNGVGGAFWLLPIDGSWPPEIDVLENLGEDVATVYQTLHTGSGNSLLQGWPKVANGNYSTTFHTYGVDWEKDYITFYLDGKQTAKYPTPADMHKPMYLILQDNASGPSRNWGKPMDSTTPIPAHFYVDYVRAYATKPDLSSGGSPTPGGSTPTAGIVSGGTYKLLARHSGKALDVDANSTADEAKVQQWFYWGGPNQQWIVDQQPDGSYTLTHSGTNKVLDVRGNSGQDGASVQQFGSNGTSAQHWVLKPTDSGYYTLTHQGTSKVLDVPGASMEDGVGLVQYQAKSTDNYNQQWQLVLLSSPSAQRPASLATSAAKASAASLLTADATAVSLYPNPAKDRLTIGLQAQAEEDVRVEVRDALARRVAGTTHHASAGFNQVPLPLGELPGGVYTLTLQRGSGKPTVHRLIVTP